MHSLHVYDLGLCFHPVLWPAEEKSPGQDHEGVGPGGVGLSVNACLNMASEIITLPVYT